MLFRLFGKQKKGKHNPNPYSEQMENMKNQYIESNIQQNRSLLKDIFQKDSDFSLREFQLFGDTSAVAFFISSLVDKEKINRDILQPLQRNKLNQKSPSESPSIPSILNEVLYYCDGEKGSDMKAVLDALLQGKTVIFIDGEKEALLLDTFKLAKRGISQPETERVVRGPRDGFIEQMQTNISLLRYRLPVPEFRIDPMEVGKKTKTKISVCYLDNIASQELIDEVKKRIQDIEIDRVLDAGYIEQFIQDNPRSPFPQVQNTERPDKAVGNILEGRVAILVDGSPFALIVPAVFNQFYQTSEDYIERYMIMSITRLVRFMALIFSLTFSSFYITVLSFHPEMIPAQFVVAASSGRSSVPFPVVVEVLLMEVAMEILREATVRMPQQVGGALSIVGVLVIGQAAVSAGFVSPITVVIIALSTIGSFATPSYNAAIAFRLLKFPLIILSGFIGLLGLATGLMFIINHMISLRSFGVPYFSPVTPWNKQGFKDALIRAPLRWLTERPAELYPQDSVRVESGVKKGPTNPLASKKGEGSNE
ncbi:spore germination protein [Salirhabdus salicampi]|uniref:spore germination protein n=1 Tax=Salirhabdus salicampi TaxID=476102 RepID=UPI0020C32015|nr:spore germination protein [Salirhabdus salicampi]MCP8617690.1 spore germination protein [Salirhabdus salicampi]